MVTSAQTRMHANRQSSIANCQFSVQDTGIGISAEQLEKIFLPFHHVEDSLTHTGGISGRRNARFSDAVDGGDEEFLLLFPETDMVGGYIVCEKMRAAIAKHLFRHNRHELSITVTLGLSIFDTYEKSPETPVKEADCALYYGKRHGRNQVVKFDMMAE